MTMATKGSHRAKSNNDKGSLESPQCKRNYKCLHAPLQLKPYQHKSNKIIETIPAAEKDLSDKRNELIKSISHVKEMKVKKVIAQENIIVQKRTLKLHQRDIENHCCICGGNHLHHSDSISINNHEPHRNEECKILKMKKRVFLYLQQSLEESNMRLKELNGTIQKVEQKNTKAGLAMNKSLISFIECSCTVSRS